MSALRGGFSSLLLAAAAMVSGAGGALLATCGPFTDTANDAFCPLILEVFYLGITTGTTATTYDPSGIVNRTQMAAFLSRGVDGVLKRASRRTALRQLWTTQSENTLGVTTVGTAPHGVQSDGTDVWVASGGLNGVVSRVRGSDARLLETWTGAVDADGVVVAMNRVLVTGFDSPGSLYQIDPSRPAGAVTTVASNLGNGPGPIAFDGFQFWTANVSPPGSVSMILPGASIPWSVTTVTVGGGASAPGGILYDGANIWVADNGLGTLLKLNSSGSVLQTVTIGTNPGRPVFDGTNIWVPNFTSNSVSVVRASSGAVLKTLTGNGLSSPTETAFDGERVLVTDIFTNAVSLWKAADLTPLGFASTGTISNPLGACSDGIGFWITLNGTNKLARF